MQKVIFFDLDGTLTPGSTWLDLNLKLGITAEEDRALFDQYKNGTITYQEWTSKGVELHKDHQPVTKGELIEFFKTISLRDGAQELVNAAKEKGYHTTILSGSVDVIVSTIAERLGLHGWLSCAKAVFDDQEVLTDIVSEGDEAPAKLKLAERYVAEHGFDLKDSISIEDGGNGVELFKHAKGVLVGNNKDLAPLAWKQVENLSEINELL